MISKEDPLKNLYVDKDEVDRLRLFVALKNYLAIDKNTASPVYLEEFYDLDAKEKIIVHLLYRRAIAALERIPSDDIGISIRDLAKELNMDFTKVKTELKKIKPVKGDLKKGRYFIPGKNIEKAVKEISTFETDIFYSTEKHTRRIK